jgi:hypothetical protein
MYCVMQNADYLERSNNRSLTFAARKPSNSYRAATVRELLSAQSCMLQFRTHTTRTRMGFALWTDIGLAWAAGTSEYRAMGAAVVSDTDMFRAADFRPNRRPPAASLTFAGHFASLGQINDYLMKARAPTSARIESPNSTQTKISRPPRAR